MSCSSREQRQRLHIHSGESHERQFHGAWLTLGGFNREGWGLEGGRRLVWSEGWIYLPDMLEWRREIPAGGHISVSVSVSGSNAKMERFRTIEGEGGGGGVIDPEDGLK